VVQVDGALDLATAPELKACLRQVMQDGAGHIVLEFAGVEFIDSSGLGVLVSIYKELPPRARRLCLVTVRPLVLRVLTLTSVDSLVGIYDSVAAAEDVLAAVGGER
jgi:anti-sigma B factor antagonist